jgi:adenosine/AMP kinase
MFVIIKVRPIFNVQQLYTCKIREAGKVSRLQNIVVAIHDQKKIILMNDRQTKSKISNIYLASKNLITMLVLPLKIFGFYI